ncbi:hypothetical protein GMDG_06166 [Pseudogymnoascus destructans 20631-21]|uniref:Uncharacterized protein n=1 Tax=Pseudogymnoascus destructans (strain ATCC MYA-4855 / 20631-21) TaxID=658429 RepID=L8FUK4_PSED2|nr:hypothetical protein GMDG_06166 [Pseudogymnoascus destructans 20631-21]
MTEATNVSPFFANYGYQLEAYRQPRLDESRAEQAMIAMEQLKLFHEQLVTTQGTQLTVYYEGYKKDEGGTP